MNNQTAENTPNRARFQSTYMADSHRSSL